jgi:hypothetical protein
MSVEHGEESYGSSVRFVPSEGYWRPEEFCFHELLSD